LTRQSPAISGQGAPLEGRMIRIAITAEAFA
jgi:hypothetical protein